MLHIFSHSPWQYKIDSLIRMLEADDDLLLIQDGVLCAINSDLITKILTTAPVNIFALKTDTYARGITNQISIKVNIIDYVDFIELTIKNSNQISW